MKGEAMTDQHVGVTPGVLYSPPRPSQKRRRCDGHLADPHWIQPGDLIVWSALPPNHPDIGNAGWWHHVYCMDCAPS
jgi:hypothetical protein